MKMAGNDEQKTKAQLIEELDQLRRLVNTDIARRREVELQLRERLKELQAVYGVSRIAAQESTTLNEQCQEIVNLLPASWQYPEITCARITIGDDQYQTEHFVGSVWKQSAPIKIHGKIVGSLEVGYLEERPEESEGPFLKEERLLLDSVAENVGRIVEHKSSEEEMLLDSVADNIGHIVEHMSSDEGPFLKQEQLLLDSITDEIGRIAERKHAEAATLAESSQRWEFALEGLGDGVWDWDVLSSEVVFSRRWKEMLGFAEEEIGSGLDEWSKRVHPDDLAQVMADVQAHLAGTTPRYDSEHRVSCKDGR